MASSFVKEAAKLYIIREYLSIKPGLKIVLNWWDTAQNQLRRIPCFVVVRAYTPQTE